MGELFIYLKELFADFFNSKSVSPVISSPTIPKKIQQLEITAATPKPIIFNPEFIISDEEFVDISMTETEIQNFLVTKGSFLKNYSINGNLTSYWIYKYCNEYGLNPKVLLSNLQKEQAFISRQTIPSQHKMNWACGCGALSDPVRYLPQWQGFDNQLKGSVLTCTNKFKKAQTKTFPFAYTTDKPEFQKLNIKNSSTLVLYNYTPYAGQNDLTIDGIKYEKPFGCSLFFYIYRLYFGFKN